MLVCVWYSELTCIPDVWPSGHYGSGPWPCVYLCVCMCMHACVCVWYTELTCIPNVWPSGHYRSGPQPCVCDCVQRLS